MKNRKSTVIKLLVMTLLFCSCVKIKEDKVPWKELFDGKTLIGWNQKGGQAIYRVDEGCIVGVSVENSPNSFLTTNSFYDDFILELEFKVDSVLNSGIQIRSNSFPNFKDGRVHGYQVEIDPTQRAMSGGIYDESRRGWLYKLDENPNAQKAFERLKWNHYRIEAIGDTIKTWINGVPAAHLIDKKTKTGFIGLQVHSLHKGESPGSKIAWRSIRVLTDNPTKYSKKMSLKPKLTIP
tara:strand:- start:2488 stop:3198 length:711 start_codon:yes stop_codon:yes gene_type:complete